MPCSVWSFHGHRVQCCCCEYKRMGLDCNRYPAGAYLAQRKTDAGRKYGEKSRESASWGSRGICTLCSQHSHTYFTSLLWQLDKIPTSAKLGEQPPLSLSKWIKGISFSLSKRFHLNSLHTGLLSSFLWSFCLFWSFSLPAEGLIPLLMCFFIWATSFVAGVTGLMVVRGLTP